MSEKRGAKYQPVQERIVRIRNDSLHDAINYLADQLNIPYQDASLIIFSEMIDTEDIADKVIARVIGHNHGTWR